MFQNIEILKKNIFFFSRNVIAILDGYYVAKGALDTDIAAFDIIYEGIFTIVYMLLVFLMEKILTMPKLYHMLTRYNKILS